MAAGAHCPCCLCCISGHNTCTARLLRQQAKLSLAQDHTQCTDLHICYACAKYACHRRLLSPRSVQVDLVLQSIQAVTGFFAHRRRLPWIVGWAETFDKDEKLVGGMHLFGERISRTRADICSRQLVAIGCWVTILALGIDTCFQQIVGYPSVLVFRNDPAAGAPFASRWSAGTVYTQDSGYDGGKITRF